MSTMATHYNSRQEDMFDETLVPSTQSLFPMDMYNQPTPSSHRGSIGGMSNHSVNYQAKPINNNNNLGGMDEDDFAAFQSSFRIPSLSPSFISNSNSNANSISYSNSGLSPHSSASPRSNFSSSAPSGSGGMLNTDDFLFNSSLGQDDLDLLFSDQGMMLGGNLGDGMNGAGGMGANGDGQSMFHLPKDWAFQFGNTNQQQQQQQQQQSYQQTQPQMYNPGTNHMYHNLNNGNNALNTLPDFSNITSPKSTTIPQNVQNTYNNYIPPTSNQSDGELRKAAQVANQARVAANKELEEVRRLQQFQAEQIQALQRASQQQHNQQQQQQIQHQPVDQQLQTIPPSWMNRASVPSVTNGQMGGMQNWGGTIIPSLPTAEPIPAKTANTAGPRKGRPPKSAAAPATAAVTAPRQPTSSGDSASPPEHAVAVGGKHNKTERRYRQKVQVAQAELRDAVPALRVHYGTSTPEQLATTDFRAEDGTVDGLGEVSRPNASAKATILVGARLYIELLQNRVAGMQRKINELEGYRYAVGGQEDLELWRAEFEAKEAIKQAEMIKMKKEEQEVEGDGTESESEEEAPKKRKRGPVPGGKKKKEEAAAAAAAAAARESGSGNGVRIFAAFAMSFSLVPSASTLLRHQPVGDISPGHVLSGEATPTQVISRLPLITAEHIHNVLGRVLPALFVPSPGTMVDWTWRLLVAAVLVLVLGPIIRAWTRGDADEGVPAGDLVELGKDVAKLGLGIKEEEDDTWNEYAARVVGKSVQPSKLARLHLAIKLRRTASTPYALALLALTQPKIPFLQSSSSAWQRARHSLTPEDPASLQAVLALPFDEAVRSLNLSTMTSSPISSIAEQITLIHLNDLYSRLFTRLVDSTISSTTLPISIKALLDNLGSQNMKADLSTFDQEIRETIMGVSKGTSAHALGLVLIGLWGVFTGPAPAAQASLISALAGEELNNPNLESISAMLDLLYPGVSQTKAMKLSGMDMGRIGLAGNAVALDKLALVIIGYIRLLSTCGSTLEQGGMSKNEKAKMIGQATADLRLGLSETKFIGLDHHINQPILEDMDEMDQVEDLSEVSVKHSDDTEGTLDTSKQDSTGLGEKRGRRFSQKMEGELDRFELSKERLVGVLSVIGRRAAGRYGDVDSDSGLDGDMDEL